MKKVSILLVLAVSCFALRAPAAPLKVGTIDMKAIFDGYFKTKEAEQTINEERNEAEKEMKDRIDTFKKLEDEVKQLESEISNPALSGEGKASKSKLHDDKIAQLKSMDREVMDFQDTRKKQLQERSLRVRSEIVDEIMVVVSDLSKNAGYDLVFDSSGASLNNCPLLLKSKEAYDITSEVLTALNKKKKEELAASAAAPAPAAASGAATPAAGGKKKP